MFSPGQHAPPPYPGQGQLGQPSHLQPTTPMFVAPPPKTQRVLHSEAYLKYIEGLNSDSSTVSKWDQALKGRFFVFTFISRKLSITAFFFFQLLCLFFFFFKHFCIFKLWRVIATTVKTAFCSEVFFFLMLKLCLSHCHKN